MNYGALRSIPEQTVINGQPHQLSYINEQEAELLKSLGGAGENVNGIPAYWFHSGWGGGGGSTSSGSSSHSHSDDDDDDDSPGFFESVGNALSSVGSAIGSGVSSVADFVSDAGSAVVDFVSDAGSAAVDVISSVGGAASDTIQEIVTLGEAETETYNAETANLVEGVDYWRDQEGTVFDNIQDRNASDEAIDAAKGFLDNRGVYHSTAAARDSANAQYAAEETTLPNITGVASGGGFSNLTEDLYEDTNENTIIESVANFFTPNDGTTYIDSVLVPDETGIDATLAANPGSSYDSETNTITGSDGDSIKIGTNVNVNDITSTLYSDLLPGGSAGDLDDFQTRYNAQSIAAGLDPYGSSTATGFLVNEGFTADLDGDGIVENYTGGTEYTVNTDGSVVVADSEEDTTSGLSLLGESMIDLGLADPLDEGEFADGSGMTDLTEIGGGDPDGIFGGEGVAESVDFGDSDPTSTMRDVYGTRPVYGDFYGGQGGGLWSRFLGSYLTRFGYNPSTFDEMVRVEENPETGEKLYYGADGQLINPESLGSMNLGGDPTQLQIGEENVLIGQQQIDPSGNIFSTTYTDLYNPELDAGVLEAGLPYSITDPATGQLVTFGSKDQYDQFIQANNAALSS